MDQTLETRVVLADRHPTMLATARHLLEAEGIKVIASAGDLAWATRIAAEQRADVIVIDLHMLGGCSRSKIADLRRRLPHTAIVILTMEAESAFVPAVFGAGACGYVLKEFAGDDLAHAVRQAVVGQRFVSEKVAA